MAKKMLSLEEIETQMVLELPDRRLMRGNGNIMVGGSGVKPGFVFSIVKM